MTEAGSPKLDATAKRMKCHQEFTFDKKTIWFYKSKNREAVGYPQYSEGLKLVGMH